MAGWDSQFKNQCRITYVLLPCWLGYEPRLGEPGCSLFAVITRLYHLLIRFTGTKRNDETGGLARKENPPWLGYERYGLP